DLSATAPAVEGTLAKIERVLPEQVRTRLQALEQTLVLDIGTPRGVPTSSTILALSTHQNCARSSASTHSPLLPLPSAVRSNFWVCLFQLQRESGVFH